MFVFVLRRLLLIPLVLLVIPFVLFGLMQPLPAEERAAIFAQSARQLSRSDKLIEQYGLEQPFYIQYGYWLREVVKGNLGFSTVAGQGVLKTIRERLPATLELAFFSVLPVVGIGIYLGTQAALHKNKFLDRALRLFALLGYSLPSFVTGFYLLAFFYGGLHVLPGIGNISNANALLFITGDIKMVTGFLTLDTLIGGHWRVFFDVVRHLILPVLTLVVVSSALLLQVMRASLLETLSSDFVRTAKAKGLSERTVQLKHARRPALISVMTIAGFVLSNLLTGSILTEAIFAYPGIGQWGAEAARDLDYAAILGFSLFTALFVLWSNLLTDILYALIDPRLRFS
jgi:ABC-type dipeptide/oligopeptide/nickel transport system permease component